MITVALSTRVGASAEAVWRALTDSDERMLWDERILGEVQLASRSGRRSSRSSPGPSGRPRIGSRAALRSHAAVGTRTRWRFMLGGVQQVLQDEIIDVDPLERLVSRLSIGSLQFDQTLTFFAEDEETEDAAEPGAEIGPYTRLGKKIAASNQVAVLGEMIPRGDVQKLALEYVDTTLRQVQKFCER